jgi:hypothetical protein
VSGFSFGVSEVSGFSSGVSEVSGFSSEVSSITSSFVASELLLPDEQPTK